MTRRHTAKKATQAGPGSASPWRYAVPLAIGWLILFAVFYFTRELPNNHLGRLTVAMLLPDVSALLSRDAGLPSGLGYLGQRVDLAAVALIIAAGAFSLGRLILRLIFAGRSDDSNLPLTPLERATVSVGLGLSAWSLLTLLFGLAGWLSRPLFICVLLAAIVGEALLLFRDRRRGVPSHSLQFEPAGRGLLAVALSAMAMFVILAGLAAMLPPFDFDVKEYHLGGPKEWFLDGRVHFLPHNVYTSFPFLTEMLSLSAMVVRGDWFRGALAGQLLLAGFLPLTLLVIFVTARRLFGTTAGLLGALVYATAPWSYRIAVIAYAEGGLTGYLALSLFVAVLAIERLSAGERAPQLTLLAGLFAGSAMACKYPGLVQVVLPIGIALVAAAYRPERGASDVIRTVLKAGAIYSAGVLITIGPWLLKNTIETGNPVYPLLGSVFDGRDWDNELNMKWKAAHSPGHYQPLNFFREIGGVAAGNDWQSLLVFAFAPLALLHANRRAAGWIWLYLGFLYAAWWLLTHRIDRFWVPLLPVACVLAGAGADWARDLPERLRNEELGLSLRSVWSLVAGGTIAIGVLFNLGFVTTPWAGNPNYLADLNAAARVVETPNLAILNRALPSDSKVLLVGEAAIFDARFPLVYNTVFDRSLFEDWIAAPQAGLSAEEWPLRNEDEIRKTFAEQGITHIYVNWREILRYRTTYGYTAFVTPDRFTELGRKGIVSPPTVLDVVPLNALGPAEREEALDRFAVLVRDSGEDRSFIAAELYQIE